MTYRRILSVRLHVTETIVLEDDHPSLPPFPIDVEGEEVHDPKPLAKALPMRAVRRVG